MTFKICMVEDDWDLACILKEHLIKYDFEVFICDDFKNIDKFVIEHNPNLILLDINIPYYDGFYWCNEIRKITKVPIIFMSARTQDYDQVRGIMSGGDDYITKPFSPKILVARVEAVLRRTIGESEKKLVAGAIEIDKVARSVYIDQKPVDLSFKEYELLTYFIENKGIALSREKILSSVWNYDYFGDARTIDTHVKKLRAKMGERGDYIKTVWGMGYKFEVTS